MNQPGVKVTAVINHHKQDIHVYYLDRDQKPQDILRGEKSSFMTGLFDDVPTVIDNYITGTCQQQSFAIDLDARDVTKDKIRIITFDEEDKEHKIKHDRVYERTGAREGWPSYKCNNTYHLSMQTIRDVCIYTLQDIGPATRPRKETVEATRSLHFELMAGHHVAMLSYVIQDWEYVIEATLALVGYEMELFKLRRHPHDTGRLWPRLCRIFPF